MSSEASESFAEIRIAPAPPEHWAAALDLVFRRVGGEAASRQAAQALAALRLATTRSTAAHSTAGQSIAASATATMNQPRPALFEAYLAERRAGAVWVQVQPGRTASFEPAQVAAEEFGVLEAADRIVLALTEAASSFAVASGARLMQTLLETDVGADARRLQDAGFQHVAELLYLVSHAAAFPSAAPAESLEFEPLGAAMRKSPAGEPAEIPDRDRMNRLAEMVQRTYAGTLDCPELDGVRPMDEILGGYLAVGKFNPANWLLVRHGGRDVGCLLLAEHPQGIWELIYMGLAPEARGHGWGLEITRYAQWLAGRCGAQRLVLAVDAKNEPALKMYAAAGLQSWDRRSAWLKIL